MPAVKFYIDVSREGCHFEQLAATLAWTPVLQEKNLFFHLSSRVWDQKAYFVLYSKHLSVFSVAKANNLALEKLSLKL